MTTSAATSPEIRLVRLDGDQWSSVLERAGAGIAKPATGAGPVGAVSRHLTAPVRARLIASAGNCGSLTRLSIVGSEVLLVLQATVVRDGQTMVEPGAELRLCDPGSLWDALQAALPPSGLLRAPAAVGRRATADQGVAAAGAAADPAQRQAADTGSASDIPHPGAVLAHDAPVIAEESAGLLVTVEAWPTPAQPSTVWMRRWSVVDDILVDVRTRDGRIARIPRPAGAVAAELQWALAGALDMATQ